MINAFKLQFSSLQHKIFRVLCVYAGRGLSFSEVARLTNATSAGVSKASKQLAEWGIVDIVEDDVINRSLVFLAKNRATRRLKQIENLTQLYESGLVDDLEDLYPGTTIVVFGSYAKGEDTLRSDIDIAIVGSDAPSTELPSEVLSRPVRINVYSDLSTVVKELRENICNGIVLSGGIEL